MTTNVSGPLRLVTDAPAMLVQVMVRAPRPRPVFAKFSEYVV